MDAFLRRVIEIREREQEADLLSRPAASFAARDCDDCGGRLRERLDSGIDICGPCSDKRIEELVKQTPKGICAACRRPLRKDSTGGLHYDCRTPARLMVSASRAHNGDTE